jgi:hypothetical protein
MRRGAADAPAGDRRLRHLRLSTFTFYRISLYGSPASLAPAAEETND